MTSGADIPWRQKGRFAKLRGKRYFCGVKDVKNISDFKAVLFDLDGVLIDTEEQYDNYWGEIAKQFIPGHPEMVQEIKGTTLVYTLDKWFSGEREYLREKVTKMMDDFEAQMPFYPVKGAREYVAKLREMGMPMAVVTSSNRIKMSNVYRQYPNFIETFDAILTSEDFKASKPDPDCYLKAAARLGVKPEECIVFEDSIKGLQSARAAGTYVVGLATTVPMEQIRPLSDRQFYDFTEIIAL
jgi:HAD superfamily hydrolase (TIGR01509 family)